MHVGLLQRVDVRREEDERHGVLRRQHRRHGKPLLLQRALHRQLLLREQLVQRHVCVVQSELQREQRVLLVYHRLHRSSERVFPWVLQRRRLV